MLCDNYDNYLIRVLTTIITDKAMDGSGSSGNGSGGCDPLFSSSHTKIIWAGMGATASVSLIMCAFTVVLVAALRLHKYFTYRLASYQVVSGIFLSLSLVLQLMQDKYQASCKVFGFFVEYFMWVKLLFTILLVFHFLALFVYNERKLDKLEPLYVFVSFFLPMLFVWIPFIEGKYGKAGAWCWIQDWKNNCPNKKDLVGIVEQFVLWYAPLFISLTISIIVAVVIVITVAKRAYFKTTGQSEKTSLMTLQAETHKHNQGALKQLLPLLAYPIIFYLLALVPLINRMYDAVSSDVNYPLALCHILSLSSWGFFSSLALLVHVCIKKRLMRKSVEYNVMTYSSTFQDEND